MSYLKACVAALMEPLMLALLLAVAAGVVAWRGRKRAAVGLLAAALIVVYVGSAGVVGDWLLSPLEARYPPLQDEAALQVRWFVVLGSSYTPHDGIPVTAALDRDALVRIVEGVRLAPQSSGQAAGVGRRPRREAGVCAGLCRIGARSRHRPGIAAGLGPGSRHQCRSTGCGEAVGWRSFPSGDICLSYAARHAADASRRRSAYCGSHGSACDT